MDGLLMFTKYAYPPNVLQYCGPAETGSLFSILKNSDVDVKDGRKKELLLQFQGAVPYLQLIAQSNGVKNIFDPRVVEAYWLGNDLLRKVEAKNIYSNVEGRFKKRMSKKDWSWLVSGSIPDAKPFHGFHVFDIYRRAGLLRTGSKSRVLETIDKCRIAWGKVESVGLQETGKNSLSVGMSLVKYVPLEFKEKKMRLGKETVRKVFLTDAGIKKGDEVAIHWDYVCDKITARQKRNLVFWTKYHLNLANKTI